MREGGQILASILQQLRTNVHVGMTGKDAAAFAAGELKGFGAQSSFLGFQGFPDVLCVSVNDVVVHGIPNSVPFAKGDLVTFDFGVAYKGMLTDSAITLVVDDPGTPEVQRLLATTEQSLNAGIEKVRAGVRVGDIASAIQAVLERAELGIIRDLVGHGVGHRVHEDPNIPNYGRAGTGPAFKAGMTIAIEPMASLGDYRIKIDPDRWAVRTLDGSLSAQFEYTILVTDNGYEILTALS